MGHYIECRGDRLVTLYIFRKKIFPIATNWQIELPHARVA